VKIGLGDPYILINFVPFVPVPFYFPRACPLCFALCFVPFALLILLTPLYFILQKGIGRMLRIAVHGWAAVIIDDEQITDAETLRRLDGLTYDDEVFTDYLGGPPEEDVLAAALHKGGMLRFSYTEGHDLLAVVTEYDAKRRLTESELRLLIDYTVGQWSDGIGENFTCSSAGRCGFTVMCLSQRDGESEYPRVEVTAN
jgi:hypothetical protein